MRLYYIRGGRWDIGGHIYRTWPRSRCRLESGMLWLSCGLLLTGEVSRVEMRGGLGGGGWGVGGSGWVAPLGVNFSSYSRLQLAVQNASWNAFDVFTLTGACLSEVWFTAFKTPGGSIAVAASLTEGMTPVALDNIPSFFRFFHSYSSVSDQFDFKKFLLVLTRLQIYKEEWKRGLGSRM